MRVRLIEIGEAVKSLPPAILATEVETPWEDIARMLDRLAHRYFDTSHAIVQSTDDYDLLKLAQAVLRLRADESNGPPS